METIRRIFTGKWLMGLGLILWLMGPATGLASYMTLELPGKDPKMVSAGNYLAIATTKTIEVWDVAGKKPLIRLDHQQFAQKASNLTPQAKEAIESQGLMVTAGIELSLAKNGTRLLLSLFDRSGVGVAYLIKPAMERYPLIAQLTEPLAVLPPRRELCRGDRQG